MAEDDSWVFDSLVIFLNGPVWNAPLQSFIEERSLIFEPNESDDVEYRKVYDDFKNLVDYMLSNFMEDIGITPQQFEQACYKGAREGVPLHFEQNTFEQIWAANDFQMFKRMMTQQNVELQLQALELIERKYGKTPDLFVPEKKEYDDNLRRTSADISPTPFLKSSELEREIFVEVSKQFPIEQTEEPKEEEIKYILEEKLNLEATLKKTIEEKLSTQKQILERDDIAEEEEEQTSEPPAEAAAAEEEAPATTRIPIDRPQRLEVDNVELKKRQEYLRAQRDKLVALKREARKKHLDDDKVSSTEKASIRPKSARAAEALLAGGSSSVIDPDKMKLRKALVQRLKSEVVQNSE